MKCPHCAINFHDNWIVQEFVRANSTVFGFTPSNDPEFWKYRSTNCPDCRDVTIEIARFDHAGNRLEDWRQVYPIGSNRGPVPPEVPAKIAEDYIEACNVLPISAKASAALSRRCLQNMLHAHGYKARDLAKEIDLLLNDADPKKALPLRLRETVDGIRHFGNHTPKYRMLSWPKRRSPHHGRKPHERRSRWRSARDHNSDSGS
jgi:hypothetical protein